MSNSTLERSVNFAGENHSVRIDLVLHGYPLDCLVSVQRINRNVDLEINRKPASCGHLVLLLYPVEYTPTP